MGRGLPTPGSATVALLGLLVVLSAVPLAGGSSMGGGVPGSESRSGDVGASFVEPRPAYGVEIEPDNVLLRVALRPNGTGVLQVEYRIRLDDDNTTEAFERHREEIESNPGEYRDAFRTDMQSTVDNAERATGRDMAVANVSVDVRRDTLPRESGVITYRFAWAGFAATNGSALVAGDALSGIYLDEGTTLIVGWPEGYRRASVAPAPQETGERSVVWSGPLYFTPTEPSLVVSDDGTTTTPEAPGGAFTSNAVLGWVADWGLIAGVLGLVVALSVVAYRRFGGERTGDAASTDDAGTDRESDGARESDASAGRDETGDAASATGSGNTGATEDDLLSNEEQVLGVLNDYGGRMKQQRIADELDWTDAKTSKVIGNMREDGAIETFRLGRENVVTLPDTGLEDNI